MKPTKILELERELNDVIRSIRKYEANPESKMSRAYLPFLRQEMMEILERKQRYELKHEGERK